jgi:hypothetical protein
MARWLTAAPWLQRYQYLKGKRRGRKRGDVRVSTSDDDSVRALAVDVLEDAAHFQFGDQRGSAGEIVCAQQGLVVDAFDGEVAAEFAAEFVAEGLADYGALFLEGWLVGCLELRGFYCVGKAEYGE